MAADQAAEYGFWSSDAYEDYIRGTVFARRHAQPHYVPDRNTPVAEVLRLRGVVTTREWAWSIKAGQGASTGIGLARAALASLASRTRGPAHGQHANHVPFFPAGALTVQVAERRGGCRSWAWRTARSAVEWGGSWLPGEASGRGGAPPSGRVSLQGPAPACDERETATAAATAVSRPRCCGALIARRWGRQARATAWLASLGGKGWK